MTPWWERLPDTISGLATRWELVVGEPVGRGGTSLVVRCRRRDGSRAMMKLSPEPRLATAEALALRAWEASGRVPAVWEYDAEVGALLLEGFPNETPLSELSEVGELGDVAGLIRALHGSGSPAIGGGLVSLAERVEFIFDHWTERHGGDPAVTGVVPLVRLARGREPALALAADDVAPVLLHGDLHPANVLDGGAERGLVAIDPRPCVGDPAFDGVDWVFWQAEGPDAWKARSQELATAIACDGERLWSWCASCAAILAAAEVARTGASSRVRGLLSLAP